MLQTTTNINVDFYDKKYILINAKQFDKQSRFLSISCYNHGESYSINAGEHSAYVRFRKADNNSVFNSCSIDRKGKIIVELTEQMLAANGICCADLVIIDKGGAKVDSQTGEIIGIENTSILSTMPIHINVTEVAAENSDIESSYEFNGFNTALEKAEAEYTEVMKTSKSWAVGDTGIRDGEDTDNSKYYSQQSLNSASDANTSALNAAESERIAGEHRDMVAAYYKDTEMYMMNAKNYMDSAKESETNAANSQASAALSKAKAAASEANAKISEENASASDANCALNKAKAAISEANAKISEENALNNANKAQSYAVGGTGTRENEDYDNALYYYNLTKNIIIGLDTGFIPMGTISFSELENVEKEIGYVYNISDDFITSDIFREGAGKTYTAGTNVYYTANEQWDCFGGAASPVATISEVKDYLGI